MCRLLDMLTQRSSIIKEILTRLNKKTLPSLSHTVSGTSAGDAVSTVTGLNKINFVNRVGRKNAHGPCRVAE
jgi:hypothetical protein